MTLPTVDELATRVSVGANDPRATAALAVALSWARGQLSRAADDPLDDLNDSGNEAVLGCAVDFFRLPAVQAALANPDNDTPATIPFDIGRRWEVMLARGNKHLWSIR